MNASVAPPLPAEDARSNPILVLAVLLALLPAVGATNQYLAQDTLKSTLLNLGSVLAAVLWLTQQGQRPLPLRLPALLWLPALLLLHALLSLLAGVPQAGTISAAVRWLVVGLLLWLLANQDLRQRPALLPWGIHLGALAATFWAVLQFWFDLSWFPQGPAPGSTFLNRNFYAELLVCSLPFGMYLLIQARSLPRTAALAASLGLNLIGVMMTSMRAAQVAVLALTLGLGLTLLLRRHRWAAVRVRLGVALGAVALVVLALAHLPTGQTRVIEESGPGSTPWTRLAQRAQTLTQTQEYQSGSISVRRALWASSARMVADRPWTGVGAGAWDTALPRYQDESLQMEQDFFAHNEYIQLVAEYGLVGVLVLLGLLGYGLRATVQTVQQLRASADAPAPAEVWLRWAALACLVALAVLSLVGFPWHMAATMALGAVSLGILLATDPRVQNATERVCPPQVVQALTGVGLVLFLGLLLQASWITTGERRMVTAINLALTVNARPDPQAPNLQPLRDEVVASIRSGAPINPSNRVIARVGDELAKWGDWPNALWCWQTSLQGRPHLYYVMGNVARAQLVLGQPDQARATLDELRRQRPNDPSLRALNLVYLSQTGQQTQALARIRQHLDAGVRDAEFLRTSYGLAREAADRPLMVALLQAQAQSSPEQAAGTWLALAQLYSQAQPQDEALTLHAYRQALQASTDAAQRQAVLAQIPPPWRARLP